MKFASKLVALLLGAVCTFGALGLTACTPQQQIPDVPKVEKPAKEPAVQSVKVRYNNTDINGTLSVDITAGSLQLTSTVEKDAGVDGSVTYTSSNEEVAAISKSGFVTLFKTGETKITATAGGKTTAFVLIVGNDLSSAAGAKNITVIGGIADQSKGVAGDYITLTPTIPEHKKFLRWDFSVKKTWTNGNVFRMPEEEITVTAIYEDMLYTLNVIGAELTNAKVAGEDGGNVKDGNEAEYDMTVYKLPYDAIVELEAIKAPEGKIFVGWDYGQKNNRMGEMGKPTLSFDMPGENLTVWAVFSNFTNRVWTVGNISGFSSSSIENGGGDPELQGMNGIRVNIPAGAGGSFDYPENIQGSSFDTTSGGSQCVKAIFKNHSATRSVTVETYITYYGIIVTSGHVTVPAGQTVEKYFTAGLGINNPWWGFAVRETSGVGTDNVPLDVVLGTAPLYPEGDKQLTVSGKAEYVHLSDYQRTNWPREVKLDNNLGLTSIAVYGGNFEGNTNANLNAKLLNLPAFDPANPTQTVYVRLVNNVNNVEEPTGTFKFAIGKTNNPVSGEEGAILDSKEVTITKIGEAIVLKLEFTRTSADEEFYFSIIKSKIDNDGSLWGHNVSIQMTYNNVMGYEEA